MANLRKINPEDFVDNPIGAADTINRIIDELQRQETANDIIIKSIVITHGIDLIVFADLRNALTSVEVLDYRPTKLLAVTDDLQDYEIINSSIRINNDKSATCRFFWNNPETYDQMEIKLRFSN